MYGVLADLVLVVHFGFVLFVALGGLLVLRWPRVAWAHIPAAAWGVAIEFGGWICPLTPLENRFRRWAGETAYTEDFVARYLMPVIYPEGLTREVQVALGALVLLANVGIYTLALRRRRRFSHRLIPALVLGCAAAAQVVPGAWAAQSPAPADLRFHHIHYHVVDLTGVMSEAVRLLDGVRVIEQGLGAGVRSGRDLVLFDRTEVEVSGGSPAAAAYARAIERLRAWGFRPQPATLAGRGVASAFPDRPIHHVAFVADEFAAAVHAAEQAGGAVLARSGDAVLFDGGPGLAAIEIVRDTAREETFWCPMHPDVRAPDAGRCPICSMALVPIPPPKIGEYRLDVHADRAPRSSIIRGLKLIVREPDTDAVVKTFDVVHEKTLHLFVISRDLTYFEHVHPEQAADGSFVLEQMLPAGELMLLADFLPAGGTPQMVQRAVISGRLRDVAGAPDAVRGPSLDPSVRSAVADGLRVTLDADEVISGRDVALTFTITDARTGAPVTDLQPYLGAPAHILIVRADLGDAVHAHPEEATSGGPTVSVHPLIPAPGDYKLWIQFQRAGRVITVPFALRADK